MIDKNLVNCCLISGDNLDFAQKVSDKLGGIKLVNRSLQKFSDGEINVQLNESVRGKNVFIIQSTCQPVNDNLLSVLILADAARRSLAKTVTVVMPYFGYARQDRIAQPHTPISAKLIAGMFSVAKVDHVVILDLHSGQAQAFFDMTVDNLNCDQIFADYITAHFTNDFVLVSPDVGGAKRVRRIANLVKCKDIILIDKMRSAANQSEVMNVIGKPKGKDLIIVDDMIDTGGTIAKASVALREKGARSITVMATHPVLSGSAFETLDIKEISKIVVTNTIPLKNNSLSKIEVLDVSELMATAIYRICVKNNY